MYQRKLCTKIDETSFLVLALDLKNTFNLSFTISKTRELGLSRILSRLGCVILGATHCF